MNGQGEGALAPKHSPCQLLLAGVPPGEGAGNAVSSDVLFQALTRIGEVTTLSHRIAALPSWVSTDRDHRHAVTLGTQPFSVHGEALLAGAVHRSRFRSWHGAWVVNSRYAGALATAGVPYIIWEATTARDELNAIPFFEVRRAGRGSGVGRALHRALLPLGERIERYLYRNAHAVLAMSAYTRDRILERHELPPDRVRVLPHPPSPTLVTAIERAVGRVAAASPAGNATRLLFVGRADDPRKNFGLLLDALRVLRNAAIDCTLTVVGPHTSVWRQQLDLNGLGGGVRFAGRLSTDELASAFGSHDLLVLSSRQEGFGIVVAEAFSAGLPVVTTRCGGPEEAVTESGGGLLVAHAAASLANGIASLACNPEVRAAMGERGRQYARSVLSFDRFARTVAELTGGLLSGAPKRA